MLTIDDDSEIRALIRYCLRRLDIDIIEAKDGESAIAAMATALPDLILLEVCMPGKDGLVFCRELRAKPECRDIPIVIVSSLGENEAISHAYDVGATDFILKLFDATTIARRVRYMLRAGKAFGDLRRSQGRLDMLNASQNSASGSGI